MLVKIKKLQKSILKEIKITTNTINVNISVYVLDPPPLCKQN